MSSFRTNLVKKIHKLMERRELLKAKLDALPAQHDRHPVAYECAGYAIVHLSMGELDDAENWLSRVRSCPAWKNFAHEIWSEIKKFRRLHEQANESYRQLKFQRVYGPKARRNPLPPGRPAVPGKPGG